MWWLGGIEIRGFISHVVHPKTMSIWELIQSQFFSCVRLKTWGQVHSLLYSLLGGLPFSHGLITISPRGHKSRQATHEFYLVCPVFLKSLNLSGVRLDICFPLTTGPPHPRKLHQLASTLNITCLDPDFRSKSVSQLLSPVQTSFWVSDRTSKCFLER